MSQEDFDTRVRRSLLDKTEDNWRQLVAEKNPLPTVIKLLDNNLRSNKVPKPTMEAVLKVLNNELDPECLVLLVRLEKLHE